MFFSSFKNNKSNIIHRHVRQFVIFSDINKQIVGILVGTNCAPFVVNWIWIIKNHIKVFGWAHASTN